MERMEYVAREYQDRTHPTISMERDIILYTIFHGNINVLRK